jgi:hypothetical protein
VSRDPQPAQPLLSKENKFLEDDGNQDACLWTWKDSDLELAKLITPPRHTSGYNLVTLFTRQIIYGIHKSTKI